MHNSKTLHTFEVSIPINTFYTHLTYINMKELLELYELDQIDKVLNHALKSDMNIEQIEGTLRDEHVIQTNGMRLLKGFKKYKFLVLKSVFLNAWNSTTVICGTDSAKKVVKFLDSREIEDTLNLEL